MEGEEDRVLDVGNLMCYDSRAFQPSDPKDCDDELREAATACTKEIVAHLFTLPGEAPPYGNGRVVTLPAPTTRLPREKPVPKKKELTTWEKFAKLKGIRKRKKDKIVYDESAGEWRRRYGYKKAGDINDMWAIPAKMNETDGLDPWTRARKEKKERVEKNTKKHKRNLQAAAGDRLPGTIDLGSAIPTKQNKKNKKKSAHHVQVALNLAQKSTASMGKFDELNKYEPKIKKKKSAKRDAEFQRDSQAEKASLMKVMQKVVGNEDGYNVNKAVNIAQQEIEAKKRAKKGKAGKRKKSKQAL
mmetsp:Transcript_34914/g.84438  ORF Transcript_34914/g.84438 Transcript_34914/m.84438 type:complete len:301 (+) Transcript_34914:341-1243(+)|eukprot:CAMPEP_0114509930 /NCGR_PEP_ID=MMETSP0109-20121206/13492_1 /TAXON_ID=29199 /ORGANISM="Chlorarachnion reptans, Strain CCCM449" /LENGTH=300 /DNA_ID=CAMNT_0001689155 /DNA_START=290 /DNA_END=1192 /DNA_ORIENTATION=+